jgi:hypothetical protein
LPSCLRHYCTVAGVPTAACTPSVASAPDLMMLLFVVFLLLLLTLLLLMCCCCWRSSRTRSCTWSYYCWRPCTCWWSYCCLTSLYYWCILFLLLLGIPALDVGLKILTFETFKLSNCDYWSDNFSCCWTNNYQTIDLGKLSVCEYRTTKKPNYQYQKKKLSKPSSVNT